MYDRIRLKSSGASTPARAVDEESEGADHAAALRLSRALIRRAAAAPADVSSDDAQAVAKAGVAGSGVDLPHRAAMEERFGRSFDGVRAHVGPDAAEACEVLGAKAYTLGDDIAFATAAPSAELVAHELSHVVQQRSGRAGSVAADEAEADDVERGGELAPVVSDASHAEATAIRAETQAPALRKRAAGPVAATTEILTEAQIKSATAFNDSHWKDPHRAEILVLLRGSAGGADGFDEADVLKIAQFQTDEGAADIDGKLGSGTMATLLRKGLVLSELDVKRKDIKLLFYPGEFEDIEAWKQAKKDAVADNGGKSLGEEEYEKVSGRAPPGTGTIYVQVGGNIVDRMEARGGPPIKLNDTHGHTADPSKAGSYKLGEGKSHVTNAWWTSQIPWGAPIRESLGEIQFQDLRGKWQWASGDRSRLNEPFDKEDFLVDPADPSLGYVTEWKQNDFGAVAFKLEGSPGLFIHTTPRSEEVFEQGGQEELTHSHGCLHVQPSDRQRLIDRGYLAKGVKIVIKKYSASLDFGATNK